MKIISHTKKKIDLCWRAFNNGVKSIYLPGSTVFHVGGATLSESNPKKTFLNYRNSLFSLLKNAPAKQLWRIILVRLFLDAISGLKFIFEFKFNHCWAIIKAHFSFYGHFFSLVKKRKAQKQKNPNYYKHRSVVWQYFVLRRKIFKDLQA